MSPSAVIGMVCLLVGLATGWGGHALIAKAEMGALIAEHARALAAQAQDAKDRESAARATERRTTLRVMETADAAHIQAADARRSAAAAAGERDRLRDRLRDAYLALASRTGAAPEAATAAPGGPPAAGPGLVLARLLDGGADLLQSCAAALDQSRIAGLACERSYDAVAR